MKNTRTVCVAVCVWRGGGSNRKVSVDNLRLERLWVPTVHNDCLHFTELSVLDPFWAGVSQVGVQRPTRENSLAQSNAS